MPYADAERNREYQRTWRRINWKKPYAERALSGQCVSCSAPAVVGFRKCDRCRRNQVGYNRKQKNKLKIEVLRAYGGPYCVCCGETILAFLTLDHVNDDGARHRRGLVGDGRHNGSIYEALKKLGFPIDPPLQVLCYNCNCGKRSTGVCPHKAAA